MASRVLANVLIAPRQVLDMTFKALIRVKHMETATVQDQVRGNVSSRVTEQL